MTDLKPTLCVIAGPNGSGKTTMTVQLLADEWGSDSLYHVLPRDILMEVMKFQSQRLLTGISNQYKTPDLQLDLSIEHISMTTVLKTDCQDCCIGQQMVKWRNVTQMISQTGLLR